MSAPQLLFSGGTGRSGTTILAKLLRTHPAVRASKPLEVRCITDSAGLLDLCVGPRATAPRNLRMLARMEPLLFSVFARRMRTRWWQRTNRLGRISGLHRGITIEQREQLIGELRVGLRAKSTDAGAQFIVDLAKAQGCSEESFWIDTSPPNIANADRIHAITPGARFIHMVRDGRDTMASVLHETWGPSDNESAATWWADRMTAAHQALSRVPPSQVLTLSLEELVVTDREQQYGRLLDFLSLSDSRRMRRYFTEQMPAARARLGSWRDRVDDPEALEGAYRTAAEGLHAAGVPTHEFL